MAVAPGTTIMKDEIRRVTVVLLLRHGYQGLRFRDIAEVLGTTRANIHHHYGSKLNLCEEVVVEYIDLTLEKWAANWTSNKSFSAKIDGMMELNRERYLANNPTATTCRPWSLMGRLRAERDEIGPRAQQALASFATTLDRLILNGIAQAIEAGELSKAAPREDIALQLVSIADSAAAITQDGGDFSRLEQLYRSFNRIVHHAYGNPGQEER
ncbi:MAG TPA: TetR/AcrR family transcriptional regulator [Bosea sp. (in: a-proteobacteria)]|uniref:TetR/AcrR family transcriptional regulator n=1 Tax=Bosea sp. (in: a-proteobacteria) TaxID=1871050 RepID=UPI002E10EA06|nr:TetR/AcrR family transcriptional regulator [Bosea sp. (in: a-proteobacteria)]